MTRRWKCCFVIAGGMIRVHSSLRSALRDHQRRRTRPGYTSAGGLDGGVGQGGTNQKEGDEG